MSVTLTSIISHPGRGGFGRCFEIFSKSPTTPFQPSITYGRRMVVAGWVNQPAGGLQQYEDWYRASCLNYPHGFQFPVAIDLRYRYGFFAVTPDQRENSGNNPIDNRICIPLSVSTVKQLNPELPAEMILGGCLSCPPCTYSLFPQAAPAGLP